MTPCRAARAVRANTEFRGADDGTVIIYHSFEFFLLVFFSPLASHDSTVPGRLFTQSTQQDVPSRSKQTESRGDEFTSQCGAFSTAAA